MKSLFITLFAIVLACIVPSCLAKPYGGWGSGSINTGNLWGNSGAGLHLGGWSNGGGWGSGAGLGGDLGGSGWAGTGGSSGPQIVSATWGASLPGPAVRLLPAVQSQLVKVVSPPTCGHSCSCC